MSAGKYASPVHVGPYATLNLAYEALTQYVKSSGYEPTGVAYEFYFSGPETPPEEIRTQIACPLKAG